MKVEKQNNDKIKVTDEDKQAAKVTLAKHSGKKVKQLSASEQAEILTALLQHLGLADAQEVIK